MTKMHSRAHIRLNNQADVLYFVTALSKRWCLNPDGLIFTAVC